MTFFKIIKHEHDIVNY